MIGAQETPYAGGGQWQAAFSWRYQKSDRHFRGSHEETSRQAEHSEVINTINLLDVTLTRTLDDRWSWSLGIPYLMAERSHPIRDDNDVTIGRSLLQARAMGDVIASMHRWMFKPATHPDMNLLLGFGIKLPTGPDNVTDSRTRFDNGEYVTTIETIDQSVQPGDGGFGALFDIQWFKRLAKGKYGFYFSGSYLFNPEGKNGVYTYRSRESESIMSVADLYLARGGASFAVPGWKGAALSLGGRIEGVPIRDVFGPSTGFRRPGYAVSIEPAISISRGPHVFSLAVPVAIYRNRLRSVPDIMDGRHGDAAFADYIVLLGYSRRFGAQRGAAPTSASSGSGGDGGPPTCGPGS